MEKLSVEEFEELREKEFDERAERAERIQNTISLFRKIACVLAVIIAAAFIFFYVRKDYNNYAGSQLVMAEVINVEDTDNKNINVAYRYNIAGKEYESNKVQYTEKIKKGDKKEIRVKKNNPEVILEYNDINFVVLLDVVIESIRKSVLDIWMEYWQKHCITYMTSESIGMNGMGLPRIYNTLTKNFLIDVENNTWEEHPEWLRENTAKVG